MVVDVEVSTGKENEGMAVAGCLDAIARTIGGKISVATMGVGRPLAKLFEAAKDRATPINVSA